VETFFLVSTLILSFLVFLCLYRGVFGPTVLDRIISVGVIGTKASVILVLIGFIYKRADMFLDLAMVYALLNFIATLAASKFFRYRKSILAGAQHLKEKEKR
jgi:multicomponent Na+:H+ antiporter subunit F